MKTVRRILAILLIISIVFAFAACSKKAMIVGSWVSDDDDEEYVTFRKDGTVTVSGSKGGAGLTFEYTVKGDKLTITADGEEVVSYKIKTLTTSKMVWVDDDDKEVTYKKSK